MSRFILTRRAQVDVQRIWNYIAESDIDAADRVRDALRIAMRKLAVMPGMDMSARM